MRSRNERMGWPRSRTERKTRRSEHKPPDAVLKQPDTSGKGTSQGLCPWLVLVHDRGALVRERVAGVHHARGRENHVRVRSRAVRRVHRARGWRRGPVLHDDRVGGLRQADYDHRSARARRVAPAAGCVGCRTGPPVRVRSVGPDHVGGRAPLQEPSASSAGASRCSRRSAITRSARLASRNRLHHALERHVLTVMM
jgi:hypothetical protein